MVREGLCGEMALRPRLRGWEEPVCAGEVQCELLQGRKSTSAFLQKGSGVEWLVRVKGLGELER